MWEIIWTESTSLYTHKNFSFEQERTQMLLTHFNFYRKTPKDSAEGISSPPKSPFASPVPMSPSSPRPCASPMQLSPAQSPSLYPHSNQRETLEFIKHHMIFQQYYNYQCILCGHKTIDYNEMTTHCQKEVKTVEVFVCPKCDECFESREELKRHKCWHGTPFSNLDKYFFLLFVYFSMHAFT